MAKQRDRVRMTDEEVAGLLAACRKVQLATISPDGYPHLVTMYYALVDGKIAFWTYRTSQKARNLARDPRITCLVETGNAYFDLRGVQIQGTVQTVTEPDAVQQIGLAVAKVMGSTATGPSAEPADRAGEGGPSGGGYLPTASKRYGYLVEPVRVISWDHAKLLPG